LSYINNCIKFNAHDEYDIKLH